MLLGTAGVHECVLGYSGDETYLKINAVPEDGNRLPDSFQDLYTKLKGVAKKLEANQNKPNKRLGGAGCLYLSFPDIYPTDVLAELTHTGISVEISCICFEKHPVGEDQITPGSVRESLWEWTTADPEIKYDQPLSKYFIQTRKYVREFDENDRGCLFNLLILLTVIAAMAYFVYLFIKQTYPP